jgi:hypothetical protein
LISALLPSYTFPLPSFTFLYTKQEDIEPKCAWILTTSSSPLLNSKFMNPEILRLNNFQQQPVSPIRPHLVSLLLLPDGNRLLEID